MASSLRSGVPAWFWVAAGVALLWEALGCFAYVTQVSMSAEQIAALPEGQRQMFATMPLWVTTAYALATWGGLVAAVLLVLRHRSAVKLFALSLVAVLVQFGWSFLIADAGRVIGPSAYPLPATIIAAALLLLWFASLAARRGWLH